MILCIYLSVAIAFFSIYLNHQDNPESDTGGASVHQDKGLRTMTRKKVTGDWERVSPAAGPGS